MIRHLRLFFFIIILLTLIIGCKGTEPTDGPKPGIIPAGVGSEFEDLSPDERTIFKQGLISSEQDVLEGLPGASLYQIDFSISDDLLNLSGVEEVFYTNLEDVPLEEVYFRLFPNAAGGKVTVSNVLVDDREVTPVYVFQDTAIHLPLPTVLQPGEQISIQMDFHVEMTQEMGGNYGMFGTFDEILVLDEFYPVIPVYDDEGWNVEAPPPNADTSYFDVSFYIVRVTAPSNLVVVASGVEVGRQLEGDNQLLTIVAGPARDFYLAASEHYAVVSETVGETTIKVFAHPEQTDGAELALKFAKGGLRSFNARFGTYPYTELDLLSSPMLALGIEYPGVGGINQKHFDLDGEVAGLPSPIMMEGTVVHEVGHQWFYNVVGNDQIDEPWLDEAITQYVTYLYYVDTYGVTNAQGFRSSWVDRWYRVDRADIPIGLPVASYVGKEYGAIVYGRGPLFVDALSEKMGVESFDEFLRDYYQSHKWGIATTTSFKLLAEDHCECDLKPLFEEWVYAERR